MTPIIRTAGAPLGGRPPEPTRTLLLVDDDKNLLIILKMFFQRMGWHILEADNVNDGIKLWTANHRHIDAVMTDYCFPEGPTGLDLVTHIQMRQRGFPCVVISGAWKPDKKPKDEPASNLFYRAKPFELRDIAELVTRVSSGWKRPEAVAVIN